LTDNRGANITYNRLLQDDEIKPHLEQPATLMFEGLGREWQHIERQVKRLGFGEQFNWLKPGAPTPPRTSPTRKR